MPVSICVNTIRGISRYLIIFELIILHVFWKQVLVLDATRVIKMIRFLFTKHDAIHSLNYCFNELSNEEQIVAKLSNLWLTNMAIYGFSASF